MKHAIYVVYRSREGKEEERSRGREAEEGRRGGGEAEERMRGRGGQEGMRG